VEEDEMPAPIPVELVPYSPNWADEAAAISARLKTATGDVFIEIHHIGSTSIPGIPAKPTIDLLGIARDLATLDAAQPAIEALGFEAWGEYGLPRRRFFTLSDPVTGARLKNLHCWALGDPEIPRHLAFRDYVRSNPEIAARYAREKERCAALHPLDSHAYTDCKSAWIREIETAAVAGGTEPGASKPTSQ